MSTTAAPTDQDYLLRAPLWRSLAHLCVPMMAAGSAGVIYNIFNAGFIGSLHSTPLLAAITFGLPISLLVMAVGGVFGVGAGTAISRLLGELHGAAGAADAAAAASAAALRTRLRVFAATAVWGSVFGGVVLGALGLVFLGPLVRLLGADAASAGPTTTYVAVQLAGAPVLVLAFAMEQLVRAEGATRASMIGLIASTVANFAFDVLFILVLGWGVGGAALALVLSNAVAVGYFVAVLRRSAETRIGLRWFRPDAATLKEMFGVGASELLMSAFMLVSTLLMNNLAVHYGDRVLAAFGVTLRIVQLPEMLCMGLAMGALPLFAAVYGARNTARLDGAIRRSLLAVAGIVAVFAVPMLVFAGPLFSAFGAAPDVTVVGIAVLTAQLVAALFNGFTGLVIALFQATAQALPATIMSVAQGVLFIPVLLIGQAMFGLNGLIWAMTVTELGCFALALALFALRRRSILRPADAALTSQPSLREQTQLRLRVSADSAQRRRCSAP